MKHLILVATLFVTGAFAGTPEERQVPIEHVYAPSGFDDNDNVEIIITGNLPNLCHKAPSSKVSVYDKTIEIKVTSLYYGENNPFCPQMSVPFVEKISLGLLEKGEYEILVNRDGQFEKTERILISDSQSDDVDMYNYAYVEYVEKELGSDIVRLKGFHVSDCFILDRIEYFSNNKDTYSILPILKQVSNFCPRKQTPFSYRFRVPNELPAGKILLHVRTLNGNSVNSIYINANKPMPEPSEQ